jgi:hypothetical protein
LEVKGNLQVSGSVDAKNIGYTEVYADNDVGGPDQTITTAEAAIDFNNPDVGDGFYCPGADGVHDYLLNAQIQAVKDGTASNVTIRVRFGPNGTAGNPQIWQGLQEFEANQEELLSIGPILIPNADPDNVAIVTLDPASGNIDVAAGSTTDRFCTINIRRANIRP